MSKSSSFQRWPAPLAGPVGALAAFEPEDVSDFDDDDEVALADEVVVFDIELEVVEGAEEASACRGGWEDVAGFRGLEGKAAGLDIGWEGLVDSDGFWTGLLPLDDSGGGRGFDACWGRAAEDEEDVGADPRRGLKSIELKQIDSDCELGYLPGAVAVLVTVCRAGFDAEEADLPGNVLAATSRGLEVVFDDEETLAVCFE